MNQMTGTKRALLVEDTLSMAMLYSKLLQREGFEVTEAVTSAAGLEAIDTQRFDVAVIDLMLPDGSGMDVLQKASRVAPGMPAIVVTADGSINRAVEAMRFGAFDFIVKPVSETGLTAAIRNAAKATLQVAGEQTDGATSQEERQSTHGFVGRSPMMKNVYERLERIGRSSATVFVTGESGTGKELAARAIHRISTRRSGPFIALNCGAIPSELMEAEVFGHVRGAFTGAIGDNLGAARAADGGTLFLDEICEMDINLQTKLLRFLQTSTVTPVGATTPVSVNARIICATNRDPLERVNAGQFREDLFYRLHVVPIHLPPLRERGADVMELARHFLRQAARAERKNFRDFDGGAMKRLLSSRWPGNVRQLENTIRRVAAMHDGQVVTAEMLADNDDARQGRTECSLREVAANSDSPRNIVDMHAVTGITPPLTLEDRIGGLVGEKLDAVERALIEATILSCGGSIPKAARVLGVSPSTIYRRREGWVGVG